MTTCFWSTYESNTWEPLPVAEDKPNHVSRKISGRKITTNNGFDCSRDYGRYNQNSGRSHSFNQRPLQSHHDHVFYRPNDFCFGMESGQTRMAQFTRQVSNQGDGRWIDRNFGRRGFVADMERLSLKKEPAYHSLVESCFEQLKNTEKFRLEKETELTASYPDKKVTSNNSIPMARVGIDCNRVERLISDSFKEQAKISTLVSAMDLYHTVHLGVYSAIQSWLDSIHKLQTAYKQQMFDLQSGDRRDPVPEGSMLLALEKLCCKTRAARTAFWSAYISFITNEWKGASTRNDDGDARRDRGEEEKHVRGDALLNKPVLELSAFPAPLMTKTGRRLIPFTLPGLTTYQDVHEYT